ncbi:MAG: NTP transferase domain-containing protein [Patescibacteria group bacterium]
MTRIIILAAGKGTRMDSELPKVLVALHSRPMIAYLLDSVTAAAVDPRPLIVVSPDNQEMIGQALADYRVDYVIQKKQLGTGHAVLSARELISRQNPEAENIIVLYGDHPFLKADSIQRLAAARPTALTMMTTRLPDFDGWRQNFYHWGRIIRGMNGAVEAITEFKDASEEEKLITEVNPALMCFNKEWLFRGIDRLRADNKQREYYLTDMVKLAFAEGHTVETLSIEPHEAMGINSLEELHIAEDIVSGLPH